MEMIFLLILLNMKVDTEPKKTPIYESHVALGAKMVDFHGWLMPLQYKGIVEEHLSVRNKAGIFDVSHMGEIEIKGKDAYNFMQYLVPNNLDKIKPGKAIYSCFCNKKGGMIDDLIIYLFSEGHILLVVNASNIENDYNWVVAHKNNFSVDIKNVSDEIALIALQGPESGAILEKFLEQGLAEIKHFCFKEYNVSGEKIIISRTGYTGEDGFELFINADSGRRLWDSLMKFNPEPAGLGARDTLRLEKGYLLYGNDADISTTPIEAGIGWTVDLNKKDFIGKDVLAGSTPKKKLVWMEMLEKAIPRQGCGIFCEGKRIGTVTSGTYSPSLAKGIAMGYIEKECKDISIEIRGRLCPAIIKGGTK